jgi:CheY-like chemotaxis protein
VSTAEAALERLQHGGYRGVITDYRLPGCSGVDLLRLLRARDCPLPVILVSAFLDPASAGRAEELGALAVLEKPINIGRLFDLAREFFEPAHSVLIVEDNVTLAENLAEALTNCGFSPLVSGDSRSALAHRALPPVALIDLRLPDGNGFDVALRLLARNPALKIVFVTAHADLAHKERLSQALWATTELLLKPFDLPQLIRRLEAFVTAA